MRITIVNDGYRNCGGGLQLIKYANQMAALGHEVVLAYQYSDTFDLIPVPLPRLFAPAMSADQLPDADIILHSSWFMADRLMRLPLSKGIPFSFVLGYEQWSGRNETIADCWRLPVYKIVPSAYLQEQVWLQSGLRWPVIPFGIDFSNFHPEGGRTVPAPGDMVVGALYNNGPTKRMPDLLDTLARLHRARPEVRFELFGFEPRPDLDFPFEYQCQPPADALRRMMSRCHVWLSMSDQEGLHVPPMEAMACGAVPVSSDIGGTRDYCLDRHNGLRFPVGDTAAAAAAVLSLLDDPDRWRTYAERSQAIIRAMGSEEDNVRKVLALFEQALAERDAGFPSLFAFSTPFESNVSTLEMYARQARSMAERGEADRAAVLARGTVAALETLAARKTGERFLSANGALYGSALDLADPASPLSEAPLYNFADTAILARRPENRGRELVRLHHNPARFDGHIRAYPTLVCNLKCPHCVNRHVPGRSRTEQRLGWEEWAAIFNREKRHVVLTGGEPFLFTGLVRLINAIEDPLIVRVYSNFSLDVAERIAAVRRPCVFYVSWHAGQGVSRETFLNNIRAVRANPFTALDAHCVDTAENARNLESDRAFFLEQGVSLPMDEDQRGFAGADPENAEPVWCARRIYLLSPEGVRYQCVSKLLRRVDPLENAMAAPLKRDRLLTRCDDWGLCAPCDGLGETVMHAIRQA